MTMLAGQAGNWCRALEAQLRLAALGGGLAVAQDLRCLLNNRPGEYLGGDWLQVVDAAERWLAGVDAAAKAVPIALPAIDWDALPAGVPRWAERQMA